MDYGYLARKITSHLSGLIKDRTSTLTSNVSCLNIRRSSVIHDGLEFVRIGEAPVGIVVFGEVAAIGLS